LTPDFTTPRSDEIVEAAEECPVDVIKFDTKTVEGDDAPAAPAPSEAEEEAVPAKAEKAPAKAEKAPAASSKPSSEPSAPAKSKSPEKAPKVSVAGDPDPAIQALLRAATARGGVAGISKSDEGSPAVKAWEKAEIDDLPPDAKQAKVMSSAKKNAQEGLSRREMLSGTALGVGWVSFGAATAVSGAAFGRFMMPNVLEEPDPKLRVGPADVYASMAIGEVNEDFKPQGFWLIRIEEGLAALNIICTHLGCIPNWLPNDRKFKCPCHGSGFYADGINFEGPAPRPLERFKISLLDGNIVVDRSKKFQYEKGEWENPDSYILV
jgi:cytochrome b6-f complex iron-sulfur subunit